MLESDLDDALDQGCVTSQDMDELQKDTQAFLVRCRKKRSGFDHILLASEGLLSKDDLVQKHKVIKSLDNMAYEEQILKPVDDHNRSSAVELVHRIADEILEEQHMGALCLMRIQMKTHGYLSEGVLFSGNDGLSESSGRSKFEVPACYEVAVVIQNRAVQNGVWGPKQHRELSVWLEHVSKRNLPVMTFIDTPGADAGDEANKGLQAHSISQLIAQFTSLEVPSIGVIYGKGYSGGAIPLASTNLLFALKDSVFNTIQPQGLAAIARKEKLSWQECAQWIGINSVELMSDGVIDGVIDYSPLEDDSKPEKVKQVVVDAFVSLYQEIHRGQNIREQRWETLRARLSYQEPRYKNSSEENRIRVKLSGPKSGLKKDHEPSDIEEPLNSGFCLWLRGAQPIRFVPTLFERWLDVFESFKPDVQSTGRIGNLISAPQYPAIERLALALSVEMFNQWQGDFKDYLDAFKHHLMNKERVSLASFIKETKNQSLNLIDFVYVAEVQDVLLHHLELLQLLDGAYDTFLEDIVSVAWEYSLNQTLSLETVQKLWRTAKSEAIESGVDRERAERFLNWVHYLEEENQLQPLIHKMNEWKRRLHAQVDPVLLVVAGYYVGTLLTRLYLSLIRGIPFNGAFQPKHIGRQKNFWQRLTVASRNVRIQKFLNDSKRHRHISPQQWIELIFKEVQLLDGQLVTKDPKTFPGYEKRIGEVLDQGGIPCGLISGVGRVKCSGNPVGLLISNTDFQAGAFDMASAEKLCRLLERAEIAKIPVIAFISSAGMQTKEGAAALFSMAVVNEAINRFIDSGNRMLVIGYGDCTGGAQASFVTHPRVDTYYVSGTNLPFAGQVVVPEHLSLQGRFSNYLLNQNMENGFTSMKGVIRHPLMPGLDRHLKEIDPVLKESSLGIVETIDDWLKLVPTSNAIDEKPVDKKLYRSISQVLIHARGCTAVRLIQAAHKRHLPVVLVQSDPDMTSLASASLKEGDRLVCLGGQSSEESYLNFESVLRVAELEGVDAIHPGIGFLSENAQFARACQNHKLNFIGPAPTSIGRMGDKAQAIATAKGAKVPTVPGSNGVVSTQPVLEKVARDIGFPLLIKASHGGGGKGIGTVYHQDQLIETWQRVKQEAQSTFGSDEVYVERLLVSVRHIEIQLLRDQFGNTRTVGIRDCSSQRNRQKIIEESGEYVLTQDQRLALHRWSTQLADTIDYVGVGTVEFLFDLDRDCFYFMEMNTRLQVEHIVTEMTSGLDLVEQQFRIAEGESIEDIPDEVIHQGHAIEVRINAESIHSEVTAGECKLVVTPSTGEFTSVSFPEEPYVRVLSVAEKDRDISPFYDNLIAQVVVVGRDRKEALKRLEGYLERIDIQGVETNLAFLQHLLTSDVFKLGEFSTQFVDEWVSHSGLLLAATESSRDNHYALPFVEKHEDEWLIKLPNAGVVYSAPSPDSPTFIKRGDVIDGQQTLVLLEVMKMFLPINLNQLLHHSVKDEQTFSVIHCVDLDGKYLQQGEVILTVKPI